MIEPIDFSLSFETANSLQILLTMAFVRAQKENNTAVMTYLDQVDGFYKYLTEYIEKNSK